MRICLALFLAVNAWAQFGAPQSNVVSVTGTADIKVVPDRVHLALGVESRDRVLQNARTQNDRSVKAVLAAIESFKVNPADVQTGYIEVDIRYSPNAQTVVDHYSVEKAVSVTLRDVSRFEALLGAVLDAGANHIYGVEFATSELRKYRDQARAMAVKAAIEKANDLASAAGLRVTGKPFGISSDSFGGGFWYGRRSPYQMANAVQNVVQTGDAAAAEGTIALGKISVTATVTMSFRLD